MASHEFRSLLNTIDAHAQRLIAMREHLTAPELAERAGRIRSAVRRMTHLHEELTGSAHLVDESGDLHYSPAEVNIAAVLSDVCRLQRELTPEAHIRELNPSKLPPVQGDATLLRQIFGNLLSNAVKYSPWAARIDVLARPHHDAVMVVVEDHGIGIPDEECDRIFEHLYRASNAGGVAGEGVGLYVVKTLLALHKGSIRVVSREGQGSRFEVQLPRRLTAVG